VAVVLTNSRKKANSQLTTTTTTTNYKRQEIGCGALNKGLYKTKQKQNQKLFTNVDDKESMTNTNIL
jgi:hypothetical protein